MDGKVIITFSEPIVVPDDYKSLNSTVLDLVIKQVNSEYEGNA